MSEHILCLNPSKQEWNVGVNGYGNEEDNAHLIGYRVKDILDENGGIAKVYCTPKTMTLEEAIAFSNSVNATRHLDIHSDAGGGHGCTGIYLSDRGRQFIQCVYDEVVKVNPTTDRGLSRRTDLGCLNQTKAVAGLIEMFFHDNYADVEFYRYHKEEYAQAIARGILKDLGIPIRKPEVWKTVMASVLNVRKGPGTGYEVIGKLRAGDKARVGYVGNGWTNIYFGEHGGWVSSQYLK